MNFDLFTLDSLIEYLQAHRAEFPSHANYEIEMRDHLLAKPPKYATHDDGDAVVILIGVSHK